MEHQYLFHRKDCPKSKKTQLIDEVLKLIAGHSHEVKLEYHTHDKSFDVSQV